MARFQKHSPDAAYFRTTVYENGARLRSKKTDKPYCAYVTFTLTKRHDEIHAWAKAKNYRARTERVDPSVKDWPFGLFSEIVIWTRINPETNALETWRNDKARA